MSYNRKFPLTRRVRYNDEDARNELDSAPLPLVEKVEEGFSDVEGIVHKRVGEKAEKEGSKIIGPKDHMLRMAYSRQGEKDSSDLSELDEDDDDAGRYDGCLDRLSNKVLIFCCGNKCWKTSDYFHRANQPFLFRGVDLIATIFSMFFFFYDVISDVVLAEEYLRFGRWISFGFTASFVVFPLLVTNSINISWYWRDYKKQKKENIKRLPWLFRVLFSLPLMCGPVVRQIEYIYQGWKSRSVLLSDKDRTFHYHQMLFEAADAGMLKMFEAFLESAPQLVLQIFIILTESPDDGSLMKIVRPAAMFGSWIGASWSLVAYHKALRASHNKEESGLSFFGEMFYYLWRACEVGPRIVTLALCAAEFKYYMLIGVAVHWLAMSIWVACQKQEMNKKTIDKVVFDIVIGYVLIFCFQNVQEGHTRYRALFYYCITFTENLAILGLWVYYTPHKGDWYYMAALTVVTTGMVFQIIVQLLYYKCFHPYHKDIKIC